MRLRRRGLKLPVWVANQGCLVVGPGVNVAFYEQSVATKGPLVADAAEQVFLDHGVADDDGTGNGALNKCVEDNNRTPMNQVCIPPG